MVDEDSARDDPTPRRRRRPATTSRCRPAPARRRGVRSMPHRGGPKRHREPRLQRCESRLRVAFLKNPKAALKTRRTAMTEASAASRRAPVEHDGGFEHPGNGRPEFFDTPRKGWTLASGMAFGPNFSRRRRASSLVRPVGAAAFISAPELAVEAFSLTAGVGMDLSNLISGGDRRFMARRDTSRDDRRIHGQILSGANAFQLPARRARMGYFAAVSAASFAASI